MAATIIARNKVVPAFLQEDENGLLVRETIHVDGLNPSSHSPLFDALRTPGMPAYRSPHPSIPDVFVRSRVPKPYLSSTTQAVVEVTYRSPDFNSPDNGPIVKFHAFTKDVITHFDTKRNPIKVNYTPKTGQEKFPEQIGQITNTKAMGVLEYDFYRQSNPQSMLTFFNRLNNVNFRGQPKYCWHLADLSIEKRMFSNAGWAIHVAMIYDEETFVKTSFYRLLNGLIPADIDYPVNVTKATGNGWTNTVPLFTANFNLLGLPNNF